MRHGASEIQMEWGEQSEERTLARPRGAGCDDTVAQVSFGFIPATQRRLHKQHECNTRHRPDQTREAITFIFDAHGLRVCAHAYRHHTNKPPSTEIDWPVM